MLPLVIGVQGVVCGFGGRVWDGFTYPEGAWLAQGDGDEGEWLVVSIATRAWLGVWVGPV